MAQHKLKSGSIIVNPSDLQQGAVQDLLEDRSSYLRSDESVTWTGTELQFTQDIVLEIVNTANGTVTQHIVQLADSPIQLANLESAWVEIDRAAASENLTVNLSDTLPVPAHSAQDKDVIVLFRRVDAGGAGYLHIPLHKQVLEPGQTVRLGASGSGDGSGGAGGINYIQQGGGNHDFEAATTGWSAYADAAGTSPIDGTGGSPTVTITRTTSTPLRGTGSGLITKDANNRQGEGVSYDFTIDTADQAKVLSITFDYAIASGTYAEGDLKVFIYDRTNSTLIQPAGYSILSAATNLPCKHNATFQTASNSTSYRLILHVSSTSASAYTVKFDNVTVGPQPIVYGAPVTDWTSYTPTVSGFGSESNKAFYYRRVGDSVEIKGAFQAGTVAASAASVTLPSGLSIDTNKMSAGGTIIELIGSVTTDYTGGSWYTLLGDTTDPTKIFFGYSSGAGLTSALTKQNGNALANNNQKFTLFGRVPITGWSSTVQMSSDTDTRVVTAKVAANTAAQSITGGATINFPTVEYDTHGAYSSGTYTVPVPGYYEITAENFVFSGGDNIVYVYKNGSKLGTLTTYSNSVAIYGHGSFHSNFSAGDLITIRAETTRDIAYSAGAYQAKITFKRLSGPSAIAASEEVSAGYRISGSTTPGTNNPIDFATRLYDTHTSVVTGAGVWKFTAPTPGRYRVSYVVVADSGSGNLQLYKNGSLYSFIGQAPSANTSSGSITLSLLVGDYIDLRPDQNLTFSNTSGGHICIEKI